MGPSRELASDPWFWIPLGSIIFALAVLGMIVHMEMWRDFNEGRARILPALLAPSSENTKSHADENPGLAPENAKKTRVARGMTA